MRFFLSFCLFFFIIGTSFGQKKLTGKISDENQMPIPFAQVFVKNNTDLRTLADVNGVFTLQLAPAEYFLVISSPGYTTKESYIAMLDAEQEVEIQLLPLSVNELEDVTISAKKSNVGREIMLEVVKRREVMNPWSYAHSSKVYIKATEQIERNIRNKKNEENPKVNEDSFEQEKRKAQELAGNMNLVEIQLDRNFAPPNKVKEYRNAYTLYGNDNNLYYTTTVKANFNFFENLLLLPDLHETPISSPISGPGILSYKYRLEKQYEENGRKIHKIKITSRLSSTSTLEGYIYVIDSIFLVQKLELTLEKGNLKKYDYFTIKQDFENQGDTLCILKEQNLIYGSKFKDQTSKCQTKAQFSEYNFQPEFAKKFFNSELAVTTQEAYERDSSFWKTERKVQLTEEEKKFIVLRDSIHDALNRKEYLDSIDAIFNKVTVLKVLWFGVEHRNRAKKTQWGISSIAATLRPLYPGGPRLEPSFNYFKKWKNQKYIELYNDVSVGLINGDVKGDVYFTRFYQPFKQAMFQVGIGETYDAIVPFDAITQVYKRSNFIEKTTLSGRHSFEIVNGLYLNNSGEFTERRSLAKYQTVGLLDSLVPNDEFKDFESYQALLLDVNLSYTPKQKYMREPYRKVVLGSKWPTFYAYYQRGVPKLFGSDVDFEYAVLGVQQGLQLGTIGTTNYHVRGGQFLSARSLKDADFKYQRRSTPLWFTNPLYGYQNQDSSLPSQKYYLEFHAVHHDNGAIINKIPYMKKTGIGLVFGFSALYVSEFKYQYYETFAGLERSFKFSKRRLRIGIYGVASDGNKIGPKFTYKISFAMLDDRNMKWNF